LSKLLSLPKWNWQLDKNMSGQDYRPLRRVELLRLIVQYFELTSQGAADPQAHAKLLAAFRDQLAQLELEEPAASEDLSPFGRLIGFVFGKA
jgi:hypothetical protein